MKYKKGGGITLSFTSPEKEFFFHIYDVITWGKNKTSADIYYSLCNVEGKRGFLICENRQHARIDNMHTSGEELDRHE
jgi:hypothetical protein